MKRTSSIDGDNAWATGPLTGVTILDLTRVLAGPYCTMVLADLGARVIKVEAPVRGDDARNVGPFINGKSAYFMSINRGKESIALDLKEANDRDIFERLLARADVLVENFRAGTMTKLGYGWETLHETYPRLIYAATSGFGTSGPYSDRPAYDIVVQAMGGVMSLTGQPGDPPTRVGTSIGDITAGLFTAIGVNSALYHRTQTGEAIMIDVAMLDCQVAILENAIARYSATGEIPGPIGSRHPSITPFEAFATSDGHLVIAAGNDPQFARLCEIVGNPALAQDPRFSSNALRTEHNAELKQELESCLRSRTTAEWLTDLEADSIPCGPIQNVAQVLADPQVAVRNMVVTAEDPDIGPLRMAGNPIKLSAFDDPATRDPAPALDANRAQLLKELER
jgi:CoA:oxalate CoA-transferase